MRSKRPRWRALLVLALASAMLGVALAGPAVADEPDESTVSSELVMQAIALAVNTPDDTEAVREKIGDALEVEHTEGVDLTLVRAADEAVAADNLHEARLLLEESIGAGPHVGSGEVVPIGEVGAARAVGAEAGVAPILDPLEGSGVNSPGDWTVLVSAAALVGFGGYLALRWRPSHRESL